MKIFVSYRRSDGGGHAGRLTDVLAAEIGDDRVFQDVAAIAAGRNFVQEIDRALAEADAVLAVIGPGWLHASSADGERRLLQPDDFVRTELVRALARRGLPVVPVLVGGAAMPMAADLPSELSGLVDRQAVIIRDETFHDDVHRLVVSLRGGPRILRWLMGLVGVARPYGRSRRAPRRSVRWKVIVSLFVGLLAAVVVIRPSVFQPSAGTPEATTDSAEPRTGNPGRPPMDVPLLLESDNYPRHYLYIDNDQQAAHLQHLNPPDQLNRATFVLVPGLSDPAGVSLHLAGNNRDYLRHKELVLWLSPRDGTPLFDQDATFEIVPAKAANDGFSLRSSNNPDKYVRHFNALFYIHPFTFYPITFTADATFFWVPASWPRSFRRDRRAAGRAGRPARPARPPGAPA